MNNLVIHTDGGARGNPGPAAIGVEIKEADTDHIFAKISRKIGTTTNNVAEYAAVVAALIWLKDNLGRTPKQPGHDSNFGCATKGRNPDMIGNEPLGKISRNLREEVLSSTSQEVKPIIHFYSDSTLVVNQINGLFKVKEGHLREFLLQVRQLESEIPADIYYSVIPRQKNRDADFLVNLALDG